jgi:hypothetical protein
MTSPVTSPEPQRPSEPAAAALFDALTVEHATVYGYGIVSARSTPEDNYLVAKAITAHRDHREALLSMLERRGAEAPLVAPGYQLPMQVDDAVDAANLALRMENDATVAWRAVVEQTDNSDERTYAVSALTQSAVDAAHWRQVLKIWPITSAFPGGAE